MGFAVLQEAQHAREHRSTSFGGRLDFLKPLGNLDAVLQSIALDSGALLLKRYAMFSLLRGRNSDVSVQRLHDDGARGVGAESIESLAVTSVKRC